MADLDSTGGAGDKNHAETAASTPSSNAATQAMDSNSGLKAPKDRKCPFCGQAFTSSSLGRHLDLYIKPRNPKPADGVHHVEEIKKIRGGITRRQPRSSSKGNNGSGVWQQGREESGTPSIMDNGRRDRGSKGEDENAIRNRYSMDESTTSSPVRARENEIVTNTFINSAHWQATGVINDIPSAGAESAQRSSSRAFSGSAPTGGQAQRLQEMRSDAQGNRIQRPDYESDSMFRLQEQAEVGRAAEMALREVLGSLQAAKRRTESVQLFDDFDFFAQPFPGLCLAILPAPTTLYSSAPFPSAESWTLSPPGQRQFEVLNRLIHERTRAKRSETPATFSDSDVFKHQSHASGAFEQWKLMSEKDKAAAWTLEILRAFTRSKERNVRLRTDLEAAHQHAAHLEEQYDRLSRCQLPREWLLRPPNTIPIPSSVLREISNVSSPTSTAAEAAEMNYDPDALLSKWKSTVKSVSRPPRSSAAPHYAHSVTDPQHSRMGDDVIARGAVFGVNGPMSGLSNLTNYETPPNPGVVVGEDTAMREEDDGDGEADADGEEEHMTIGSAPGARGNFVGNGLVGGSYMNIARSILNGKRPLEPNTYSSRKGKGAKLYKEQSTPSTVRSMVDNDLE